MMVYPTYQVRTGQGLWMLCDLPRSGRIGFPLTLADFREHEGREVTLRRNLKLFGQLGEFPGLLTRAFRQAFRGHLFHTGRDDWEGFDVRLREMTTLTFVFHRAGRVIAFDEDFDALMQPVHAQATLKQNIIVSVMTEPSVRQAWQQGTITQALLRQVLDVRLQEGYRLR